MRTIESDWWVMDLPDEWEAEQDDETIVLSDEDGVGILEITTLQRDDAPFDARALAADLVPPGCHATPGRLAGLAALCFRYVDEDSAVRDWVAVRDDVALLVTYHCATEHAGLDDALIDEMLETLELRAPAE